MQQRTKEMIEDKIFTSFYIEMIIKEFQNHTGYHVCKSQEEELRKFLYEWSLKNIEKVKEE